MTDITVSTLIQQIESHVRANRPAQALALSKHILYYFPKHLETYSLMAQALMVQGNLDGALNIYRRVLSADPENPGAYAGLARIFDARHDLEEALWHMERAYELAPAQPEIRQGLTRLYGQHETAPRERLKLTRGALARLYVQEGLYDQAIHEFREIGSSTLSRYDIRVALAEAMWRAGRTREAANVAQSLLDALPYCLKANLILGTAWQESAIPESQKYLERAVSLDPSNQVAQKMLGTRSPLRVTSVTVPEYVEGTPPPYDAQKETPAVIPLVPLTEEDKALSIFDEPKLEPAEAVQPEPVGTTSSPPDVIVETPHVDLAENIEPPPTVLPPSEEPTPSILDAELPPWVRRDDTLPVESAAAELPAARSSSDGDLANPDWLVQLRRNFADEPQEERGVPAELIPVPAAAEPEPQPEPESPPVAPQVSTVAEPKPEVSAETTEEDLPAWLRTGAEAGGEKTERVQVSPWLTEPASVSPESTAEIPGPDQTAPPLTEPASARAEIPAEKTAPTIVPMPLPEPPRVEAIVERTEMRVPKWVEVLSRREPAESRTQEKTPAPSESVAPLARSVEPAPAALSQPAGPIAPASEDRVVSVQPEPMPPLKEHLEPATPTLAESPVPPIQTAEPEHPLVAPTPPVEIAEPERSMIVETPSASEVETLAQTITTREPKYYSRLAQARAFRTANRLGDALREYEYVITKSLRLVPEVILDLESLVATGNAPLDAHRLLGDAYTRAGRLNDALERYRYVKRQAESSP